MSELNKCEICGEAAEIVTTSAGFYCRIRKRSQCYFYDREKHKFCETDLHSTEDAAVKEWNTNQRQTKAA